MEDQLRAGAGGVEEKLLLRCEVGLSHINHGEVEHWMKHWSPLLLQKMETTGVPLRIPQDDMDYKRKWTGEYVWEFIPHYHTSTLNFKSLAFSPSAKSIKNHLKNRFYKTLEESDDGWVFKNLSGFLHVSPAMDQ